MTFHILNYLANVSVTCHGTILRWPRGYVLFIYLKRLDVFEKAWFNNRNCPFCLRLTPGVGSGVSTSKP